MTEDQDPPISPRLQMVRDIMLAMNVVNLGLTPPKLSSGMSLVDRLCALNLGDSEAKAELCDTRQAVGLLSMYGNEQREALRNRISGSVIDATNRSGFQFMVEVTTMITLSNNFYHVAIISRIE